MRIEGRCHCGNISYLLHWPGDGTEIPVRVCGCTFCTKHGGAWTSHRDSELVVAVRDESAVSKYRFGTETAVFHVCSRCGAVPLVTSAIEDHLYAVVNVNTFEGVNPQSFVRTPTNFDGEDTGGRLERRKRNWIRTVRVSTSGAAGQVPTNPIDRRLAELDIALPAAPQPLGAYRAAVRAGALLFLSGQLPIEGGAIRYKGRVGAELTLEEGRAAAELTALNALAQIRHFLGGFDRLRRIVRLDGYVASAPGFYEQPKVLDGASELLRRVLDERAGHARTAFAVGHLPANAAIELVVTAEVE